MQFFLHIRYPPEVRRRPDESMHFCAIVKQCSSKSGADKAGNACYEDFHTPNGSMVLPQQAASMQYIAAEAGIQRWKTGQREFDTAYTAMPFAS